MVLVFISWYHENPESTNFQLKQKVCSLEKKIVVLLKAPYKLPVPAAEQVDTPMGHCQLMYIHGGLQTSSQKSNEYLALKKTVGLYMIKLQKRHSSYIAYVKTDQDKKK